MGNCLVCCLADWLVESVVGPSYNGKFYYDINVHVVLLLRLVKKNSLKNIKNESWKKFKFLLHVKGTGYFNIGFQFSGEEVIENIFHFFGVLYFL